MTDHTTHDLALARAERDAWQTTCEELHADACVDEDGIYTCVDETACSAAIAAKESAK